MNTDVSHHITFRLILLTFSITQNPDCSNYLLNSKYIGINSRMIFFFIFSIKRFCRRPGVNLYDIAGLNKCISCTLFYLNSILYSCTSSYLYSYICILPDTSHQVSVKQQHMVQYETSFGCHDGHLGYLNRLILAFLNLYDGLMPPPLIKVQFHSTYI